MATKLFAFIFIATALNSVAALPKSSDLDAKRSPVFQRVTKENRIASLAGVAEYFNDSMQLKDKESQCIVGEGAMPMPDVFRALVAIGYRGYANLEYEIDATDPLPGMKQSFAHLRGILAGLSSPASRATRPSR